MQHAIFSLLYVYHFILYLVYCKIWPYVFCCLKKKISVDRTRHSSGLCLHWTMVTIKNTALRGGIHLKFVYFISTCFKWSDFLKKKSLNCRWLCLKHSLTWKPCVVKIPGNLSQLYSLFSHYDVAYDKVDFYPTRLICYS